MLRFRVIIKLEEDPKMPVAEYRFFSIKQNKDITETFESN
jgi:hypothetical protein